MGFVSLGGWNVAPGGIYPDQVGSPAFSLQLFSVNCPLLTIALAVDSLFDFKQF
jgi:hypothetical protein